MTLFNYALQHSAKRMAILIPLLAASPLAAQAQTAFSPPQNVSSNPGASYLSQVAVDSKGSINIVWVDNTPGYYAVFFSRSTDGGATFSTPQNLSTDPAVSAGGAQIAVDSSDNINVIWPGFAGQWEIFLSRSSDGGVTFSAPKNISNNLGGADSPYMAVDSAGNINVVWVGASPSVPRIVFFSRSSDGGATFSTPVAVSTSPSYGPQVAVDSAGNINVAWIQGQFYGAFSRSSDGGTTFSPPKVISGNSDFLGLLMALDSKGNIYIVWDTQPYGNIYLSHSSDSGATFSFTNITNNTSSTSPLAPQIAIDPRGNINVVWAEFQDIFFGRSSDGGATFSTPQNLSNDPGDSYAPQIATDSSGNINVVWQDKTPGNYDIFFTRSSDGGGTFSAPENLSNDPGDSDYPQIVVDSSGSINVVWTDNTPGNLDIFFSRSVSLSALRLDPSSVAGGDSSTGTVTLSAPAPGGGAIVSLSSSDTSVATVPASVTVPAGATTATLPVSTSPVGTSTSVTISGSYGGGTATASLSVTPPTLTSLTLHPSTVVGGPLGSSTGAVTLSGPAPSGGAIVSLSSSNPSVASAPASVTVPAGATSATFTVSTSVVIGSTTVTISGSFSSTTQSASLTLLL
jgi:hypothetical protein